MRAAAGARTARGASASGGASPAEVRRALAPGGGEPRARRRSGAGAPLGPARSGGATRAGAATARSPCGATVRRRPRRARTSRLLAALGLGALVGSILLPDPARAIPVAVGSAGAVLSWGIDPRHPHPSDRGGVARAGRLSGAVMRAAPAVGWELTPTSAHPRGPVVDEAGRAYFGTTAGLLAVDRSGEIAFETPIAPVDALPALLPDGSIVVASRDRDVAVVGRDGTVLRRVVLGSAARASPLVLSDGSIVLALLDRTLVRLRADLEVVFATNLPGGALGMPALAASGRIAVTSGDLLYLVEPRSGAIEASVGLGDRAIGPAVRREDGTLLVLVAEGAVVAVEDESAVAARWVLGGRLYAGGALALAPDGSLVVAVPARGLVCLAPDGTERWLYTTDAPFYGVVSVDTEGRSVAIDRRGRLTVVDAAGALLWRMELAALEAGGVALDGTRLVVATDRPSVFSLVPAP